MQLPIEFPDSTPIDKIESVTFENNKLLAKDGKFHDWYRFVLSFPPHLVRHYIDRFNADSGKIIVDPFCGTGTTIVESKINGIGSIGVEANPFLHFVSSVKINWAVNVKIIESVAREIGDDTLRLLKSEGIDDNSLTVNDISRLNLATLDEPSQKLLISNSISPLPLHKTLVLLSILNRHKAQPYYDHFLLALANALVFKISNLRFGPEVGVAKPKSDYPVVRSWLQEIKKMTKDIGSIQERSYPNCFVKLGDARRINHLIDHQSVDIVITSPPYPNEKDYTRTTRLESVILGFIKNKEELRKFKKTFVRSNTRGVYKNDNDDKWILDNPKILKLADEIEKKRVKLGKTSGFEKLYSKVALQYFGGMAEHFANLRYVLKPDAMLAYVVGDQASYLQIMIRTGELLADIAQSLGYELVDVDLFRKRFATATSSELREEVIILRWPGWRN